MATVALVEQDGIGHGGPIYPRRAFRRLCCRCRDAFVAGPWPAYVGKQDVGRGRDGLRVGEYLALASMNSYTRTELPLVTLPAYVVHDISRLDMIIHD